MPEFDNDLASNEDLVERYEESVRRDEEAGKAFERARVHKAECHKAIRSRISQSSSTAASGRRAAIIHGGVVYMLDSNGCVITLAIAQVPNPGKPDR